MNREFRVYVYLPGDTKYLLCSTDDDGAAAEIIRVLCSAQKPEYTRIEVEIGLDLTPAR